MIPLDRNESYWLLDDELTQAACALGVQELSRYPDYGELRQALAAYAGVAPEQILVSPGSDAAIEHVAHACVGSGGVVALPVPTFYGYETILDRAGVQITPLFYIEQGEQFIFPRAQVLEALAGGAYKALFLCNPNNPLGCSLSPQDISDIVAAARGSKTLLVVDEAYFEFSSSTFLPYLAELSNLIILRTFSKGFGLSGARVGYFLTAPEIVQMLGKQLLPWPIAHASVASALALLARADAVKARRDLVVRERDRFITELQSIPSMRVYPSETNFVLVRVPDAERVRDALLLEGVRVALGESMSRFPEAKSLLKNTLRIAVPSPEERVEVTQHFVQILAK